MNKIKVGIVSYLNTLPLIYGLQKLSINKKIELIESFPKQLVELFKNNEIELGLLPVAALKDLETYHLVGNYCIATDGTVGTVCLFSDVNLEDITTIYLDYQSRTSVELLKWLLKNYWKINPKLIAATDDSFREKINGTTAGLIIGDRAFEQRKISKYTFDLGSEWKKATGFSFVFAVWVSKNNLSPEFIKEFDTANAFGLNQLDEIVANNPYELYDLKKYFTENICYNLDEEKRKAMNYFLSEIEK